MNALHRPPTTYYRTGFLPDIHLGTCVCQADVLARFLRVTNCDRLYLVGDLSDGWRLRKSCHWDAAHDDVLRLILCVARAGTTVTYIPGNHDEMFRAWQSMGLEVACIRLALEAVPPLRLAVTTGWSAAHGTPNTP
jgi:UDP-2,3-diacylglucosamine pyrophosphatase LpxH